MEAGFPASRVSRLGEFPGKASFPARRVSRLGEFPGMYRKCTVLRFPIYMDSQETLQAGSPVDRGGISLSRVSRLTHVNTNSRVSCLSGIKEEHKFLADYIAAGKNTMPSSKSAVNYWKW